MCIYIIYVLYTYVRIIYIATLSKIVREEDIFEKKILLHIHQLIMYFYSISGNLFS